MQHTARHTLAPFFCLALALAPATARAAPLAQTTVQAASGRSCLAFLQASPGALGLPLVVASHGSGLYTNVHDRFPVGDAVRAGRVALLSVDKPGVRPNPDKPGEPLVDDAAYNDYTPEASPRSRRRGPWCFLGTARARWSRWPCSTSSMLRRRPKRPGFAGFC
jgi:hypothetical protein